MEELRARFTLEDDMSDGLDSIADSIDELVESLEDVESASQGAFDSLEDVSDIASSVDEISSSAESAGDSLESMGDAFSDAGSGADDLATSTSSAEDALAGFSSASEEVAQASQNVAESTQEAGQSAQEMGSSVEEAGNRASSAISSLAGIVAGAGIAAGIKEIAEAANEMAEAFSDAEKTIVNATGATGSSLAEMSTSALDAFRVNDESLQDSAGVVGEWNTRAGLTGEALTDMSAKMLDFSDVTGQNGVSAVRNLTQVMHQWGLSQAEATSLMDKFTYTGQRSGISVDSLADTLVTGGASFQAAGLSIDNAINMLGDFELAGIRSNSAIMAMRTAVNKLSKSGVDVKSGLQDAIREIATMDDASQATAKAVDLFGSRAGQQLALAIRNGTVSIDTFNSSLDQARGTLQVTAEAGESLSDKWQKAFNNVNAGFTKALEPGIKTLNESMSSAVNGVGDFLNENTELTTILGGAGAGIAALTGSVSAYVAAAKMAGPVTEAFKSVLGAGFLGPLGAATAAVAALGAAFFTMSSEYNGAYEEQMSMTASTNKTKAALDAAQKEYDILAASHQLSGERAENLRMRIDELTTEYEQNGMSVQELQAQTDSYIESHDNLMKSIGQSRTELQDNALRNEALINNYEKLAKAEGNTGKVTKQMEGVYSKLQDNLGDVGVSMEELASGSQKAFAKIRAAAKTDQIIAEQKAAAENWANLITDETDLLKQKDILEQNIADNEELRTQKEIANEEAKKNVKNYDYRSPDATGQAESLLKTKAALDAVNDAGQQYQAMLDSVNAALAENQAQQQFIEQAYQRNDQAIANAINSQNSFISGLGAGASAISSMSSQLLDLAASYDQVYQATLQSYEGQFGLFDKAQANYDMNTTNLVESLTSQRDYWNNYSSDLGVINGYISTLSEDQRAGMQDLISELSSGTPEMAGLAHSYAEAISQGKTEVLDEITNLSNETQTAMESATDQASQMMSDLPAKIQEFTQQAVDQVKSMDLAGPAEEQAMKMVEGIQNAFTNFEPGNLTESINTALSDINTQLTENDIEATVTVTAEVEEARAALEALKSEAEAAKAEMKVTLDKSEAESGLSEIESKASSMNPKITATADVSQANSEIQSLSSAAEGIRPVVHADADLSGAESKIQSLGSTASGVKATVNTDANISNAQSKIQSLEGTAAATNPTVHVGETGVAAVQSEINGIQGKTVTITINKVTNEITNKSTTGHAAGTTYATTSSYIAGERGPELIARRTARYASGTTNSDDYFIAGENGPELVEGAAGSTVFPASETNRLIDVLNDKQKPLQIFPNADGGVSSNSANESGNSNDKHFSIDINGSGSINVGGSSMDKEQVLNVMMDNVKPVLMKILQSEIYEEGDLSYDY